MSEQLLERTLAHADMEIRGDGRTVYGLAVPFDRETNVNDGYGPYREVFRNGAFTKTLLEGADRVKFYTNHSHRQNKLPIGRALALRQDPAGLVGEFRVSKTGDGDEALELVRDGVLDSFSVGFAKVPGKDREHKGGLVERLEVKLREVSLVAHPAYEGAMVAGVRSQFTDEELERVLALIRDSNLDTQQLEAALSRTSNDEPSAMPDEPVVGHSIGTRTHAQRQALLLTLERFK